MLTASRLVTTRAATPSQQHMASNSRATRPNRQATDSSRDTSSRASSSNRLLLLTLLRLLVPMDNHQPTSTANKVVHPVITSPTITVSIAFHPCVIEFITVKLHWLLYVLTLLCSSFFVDNYRQDGQGGGSGYSGSESSRYTGESRGPGREGFDRGGMMHRGRGGMGRGMG